MTTKRGISYPLQAENGDLKLSEDADLVAEHIYSVIETRPGERVLRRRYALPSFAFEGITNPSVIAGRIEVALVEYVSDPDSFTVEGTYEESGLITIDIRYQLSKIAQPPIQFRLRS